MFEQPEKSYSWWDYREFAFRRNRGLRIDHILVSQALKARVSSCVIDRLPRKNERPSDHVPVTLELEPNTQAQFGQLCVVRGGGDRLVDLEVSQPRRLTIAVGGLEVGEGADLRSRF